MAEDRYYSTETMALWLAVDVAEVCQQLQTTTVSALYDRLKDRLSHSQIDASLRILQRAGLITVTRTAVAWTGGRGQWPRLVDNDDSQD